MEIDKEAGSLLKPLRDSTSPPSALDIGAAVAKGRRRVLARRLTGAALIFLVPVSLVVLLTPDTAAPPVVALEPAPPASPPPAAFPVACTARTLPTPPGATFTLVEHGDPSGRYLVGVYEDPQGNRRPLLWDGGNLVVLSPPGDDTASIVVNEQGVVAGTSTTAVEGRIGFYNWTYRGGAVELITEVGHGPVEHRGVVGINARGDILLDSRTRVVPAAEHQGPAIWSNGRLRELSVPAGLRDVIASGLDDDGTVVGRHRLKDGLTGERPLVWTPDGKLKEFNAPKGFGPAGSLREVRAGQVVGAFQAHGRPDHEPVELVGDLRSGDFAPAGITMAFGMNRHGWVAGFEAGPQRGQFPAIAGGGKKLALPIPQGAMASDEFGAASISDDGRTVGGTVMVAGTGAHIPVLWACHG